LKIRKHTLIKAACRYLTFSELVFKQIKHKYKIDRIQIIVLFQLYYYSIISKKDKIRLSPSLLSSLSSDKQYNFFLLRKAGLIILYHHSRSSYYMFTGLGLELISDYDKLYNEAILEYERKYNRYLPF
jgi:hypothetical protein